MIKHSVMLTFSHKWIFTLLIYVLDIYEFVIKHIIGILIFVPEINDVEVLSRTQP